MTVGRERLRQILREAKISFQRTSTWKESTCVLAPSRPSCSPPHWHSPHAAAATNDGAKPAASKSQSYTADPAEDIAFGKTYTWPDGLKVPVTEARIFTDFTADEDPADPKSYEFRAKLWFTNVGKAAADLSDISTIIMGATNDGKAASSAFQNGAAPLEGRLAPGVTATKTDDGVIDRKYGRKILIIVQRGNSMASPEFIGSIVG
ncbi:hypothetical protein [Actinacidiphila soli]|uniref:hypothetical protein n=1 Tax=Actinacidiphila soli TaxID=2487275 RepID=UPI000FCA5886|nr:hypothetical protein [Actinacidiphila soli]